MTNERSRGMQYLFAGVSIHPDNVAAVSHRALQLKVGQREPHWRDESTRWKLQAIDLVCEVEPIELAVVRGRPHEPSKQERSRRCCLEHLLYHLDACGERELILDSRRPDQNRADVRVVEWLRAQKAIKPDTRLEHRPSKVEPALWLSDVVAGAFQVEDPGFRAKLLAAGRCVVLEVRVR